MQLARRTKSLNLSPEESKKLKIKNNGLNISDILGNREQHDYDSIHDIYAMLI